MESTSTILAQHSSYSTLRSQLRSDLAGKSAFDWIFPATITTDEAVDAYLAQFPPRVPPTDCPYDPCLFEDHLRAAGALLDRCEARYAEILELEMLAITTLVDLTLEEELQPHTYAIAKVELKASRSQGNATADDADESKLKRRDEIQTSARQFRESMHRIL